MHVCLVVVVDVCVSGLAGNSSAAGVLHHEMRILCFDTSIIAHFCTARRRSLRRSARDLGYAW